MTERTGAVTFEGNPLTLLGDALKAGIVAPDFEALDNDLNPVRLSECSGKVRLISSVPSLDTGVCDRQTRRFNEEIGKLGPDVLCLTVSADLPFAQARWCAAAGVDNVQTLSDHREMQFGQKYGVLIKELRLNSRAVFVVDAEGMLRYVQYVTEITEHPDYAAALAALKDAAQ